MGGTGIPILDTILGLIDQYKTGIAIMGVVVVAIGLLLKPVAPDFSASHRGALVSMVVGGILLALAPTIASAIVGG